MGFMPGDETSVSGAIVSGEGYVPSSEGSKVYLNGGDDLGVVLNKVEGAGGTIAVPKTQISPEPQPVQISPSVVCTTLWICSL